ncbi:DNA topoisomerase 1-like [Protopterus annectens]|uniref:DNA topoisomerase 1-like n=1 Tax=Protopterus annectens TaxID=7888 RepID=UPI001CF9DC80|nr:DNA topoisomerase 1-like [Protopterus annectens]
MRAKDKSESRSKADRKKSKESNVEGNLASDSSKGVNIKEEPEDFDFQLDKKQKKGKKRSRNENEDSLAFEEIKKSKKIKKEKRISDEKQIEKEEENHTSNECVKEKMRKEVDEKGSTRKKTKEEREAAAALKLKKKEEEEQQRWRWWEEKRYEDRKKWAFLEHKGPLFAPPYEVLPETVTFYYNGKPMQLSPGAEEVASFFAKMLDHEYTVKEIFRDNFFKDWRKEMTLEEKLTISDLSKCDFSAMHAFYKGKMEEKKNLSKEDKLVILISFIK